MASRILHYVILTEIAKRIVVDDIDRFIYGGLLPDASDHKNRSYNIAHFEEVQMLDGKAIKGINWTLFEEKFQKQIKSDSLYMGYLCHLIADAIWFKRITDQHIRKYPKEERVSYIKKGYEDFMKMNSMLIEKYSLEFLSLQYIQTDIDGIVSALVEPLLKEFANDFNIDVKYSEDELLVYPYKEVLEFIDESVQICICEINALKYGNEKINPYSFYTEPRP